MLRFTPYTDDEKLAWYARGGFGTQPPPGPAERDFYFPQRHPRLGSLLHLGYAPPGGYVKDFSICHDGRAWHLFHIDGRPGESCNVTGNETTLGHASTGDLADWIRHPCPLAIGESNSWEGFHVFAPFVMRNPFADQWLMYYAGSRYANRGPAGAGISHIGIATSSDLVYWDKHPDNPVFTPSADWSVNNCRDPHVLKVNDRFLMITTTNRSDGKGALALAESTDLLKWREREPLRVFEEYEWAPESAGVLPMRSGYVCWFSACLCEYTIPLYIMTAESLEGFAHAKPIPVAGVGPRAIGMEVLHCGRSEWLVAYFSRIDTYNFRLFFGVLDLADPARPNLTAITRPEALADYARRNT